MYVTIINSYICVLESEELQMTLYDKDTMTDHDFLGHSRLNVQSVVKQGEVESWISLDGVEHGQVLGTFAKVSFFAKFLLGSLEIELVAHLQECQRLSSHGFQQQLLQSLVDDLHGLLPGPANLL